MMGLCPHCNQRYLVSEHCGDFIHDCANARGSPDWAKNDDLTVIGNASDADGSVFVARTPLMAGQENRLFGSNAELMNVRSPKTVTVRGRPAQVVRQRGHGEYIKIVDEHTEVL